jgi:hypothetical protein
MINGHTVTLGLPDNSNLAIVSEVVTNTTVEKLRLRLRLRLRLSKGFVIARITIRGRLNCIQLSR